MDGDRTTKRRLVERALRRWLVRGAVPRLPSVRVLARQFNTTPTTVSATIDALAAEGLVTVVPRSGTYATAALERIPDPHALKPGSVERLVVKLRDRIARGVYPSGAVLPKVAALCSMEGVAARTVQKALERLREEGLVSRRGRTHVVGLMPPVGRGESAPLEGGVVVVIQWREGDWAAVAGSPSTRSFAEAFMREMAGRCYEIEPVVVEPRGNRHALPAGLIEVAKLIRALGPRYAGSLVIAPSAGRERELYGWLGMLATVDRPVVWFDQQGEVEEEARYEELLRHKAVRKRFVRCRVDRRRGSALALRELALAGHRVVGFVAPTAGGSAEEAERGRELLGLGLAMVPQVVVIGNELRGWGPLFSSDSTIGEVRARLATLSFPGREALRGYLAEAAGGDTPLAHADRQVQAMVGITQWVGPLLARRPTITALIAPNDRCAKDLCEWAAITGIEIPREMTIVSLEARFADAYPHSISSVDYGLDHLGYQAFHAVAGDVSLGIDAARTIEGRCRLTHRGSIAQPRPYPVR